MQAPYEALVHNRGVYPVLEEIADLYGRAERTLFVEYADLAGALDLKTKWDRTFPSLESLT